MYSVAKLRKRNGFQYQYSKIIKQIKKITANYLIAIKLNGLTIISNARIINRINEIIEIGKVKNR